MNVYTKNPKTLLYNQNGGTHAASPILGTNTLLVVGENSTTITGNNRGPCYRITANGAYVSVGDVALAAPPPVDPPPPPPPVPVVTRIVTVTVQEDGWKTATANITQEKA